MPRLPRYSPAAQRHSWTRDGHVCRWCGLARGSWQADPADPRSWFQVWVWPADLTAEFDNTGGRKFPRCPLPRGTRVQVRAGACDAAGRLLPGCPARVVKHWVGVWDPEDGPAEWYDLTFDDGRFRTVAPSFVSALAGEDQP